MRIWGREPDGKGGYTWVEITTDSNGMNANVYLTALTQVLKLNLLESPFYANYGIPQYQTMITQVFPTYYVMLTQQQYAPFFASLVISPIKNYTGASGHYSPAYNIQAVTKSGAVLNKEIAT